MTIVQELLAEMHTKPKQNTGAWWRGECADGCKSCQVIHALKRKESKPSGKTFFRLKTCVFFGDLKKPMIQSRFVAKCDTPRMAGKVANLMNLGSHPNG